MKRTILSLAVLFALLTSFAFTWSSSDTKYDYLLDEQSKSEMLFSTTSDVLQENLAAFLAPKLDKVDRVDAHFGTEKEYYFTVYGQKDGQATAQQVLVSEEMVCQQSFPTLKEMGMEQADLFVYCYWVTIEIGPLTLRSCQLVNEGVICGVSPTGITCFSVRELPHGEL